MSREIKFRAWNYDDQKMYDWDIMCNAKGFGIWQWLGNETAQEYNIFMQYTGKKDVAGTEAYHQDLVKSKHYDGIGIIEWVGNGWAVEVAGDSLKYSLNFEFTIVGNTYANPQLLKDK